MGGIAVDDLGGNIQKQREAKHLTIEELSQLTKISPAVLRDIESGKFDRYKGDEAYVKMYLKKISLALNMDSGDVTQQYVDLTKEIELEEIKDKKEEKKHNRSVEKKDKKISFHAPEFTRKPSVYEDKSHVAIIRTVIVLVLVCLVIVAVWYGFFLTSQKEPDPLFTPPKNPTVQGEVDTNQSENNENNNQPPVTQDVLFTRNSQLDFSFKLPPGTETFTFKMEFANSSWNNLKVNGIQYSGFESRLYQQAADGTPETVELEFNVNEFENLTLRIGYCVGHKFYINNQEIPLEEEDTVRGAVNMKLALEKE